MKYRAKIKISTPLDGTPVIERHIVLQEKGRFFWHDVATIDYEENKEKDLNAIYGLLIDAYKKEGWNFENEARIETITFEM